MDILNQHQVLDLAMAESAKLVDLTKTEKLDIQYELDLQSPHKLKKLETLELTVGYALDESDDTIYCFVDPAHGEGFLAEADNFEEAEAWFISHFTAH